MSKEIDVPSYLLGKGAGGGGTGSIKTISVNGTTIEPDENKNVNIDVPIITYGTTDLTPGVSELADGTFYFVYE